ncbi:MAG TPA: hypothetical protein VIQ00_03015 [Chitinophagaceae bacterium]
MKTATLHEIKLELNSLLPADVVELCTRLARFKKENKELLTYLLFEAHNEQNYIDSVKKLIDEEFAEIKNPNLYFIKKTLRKILRITNKYARYSGSKTVEIELLIHFCMKLKKSEIPFHNSTAISNLYLQQIKKIKSTLTGLHEDLQYDYIRQVEILS